MKCQWLLNGRKEKLTHNKKNTNNSYSDMPCLSMQYWQKLKSLRITFWLMCELINVFVSLDNHKAIFK